MMSISTLEKMLSYANFISASAAFVLWLVLIIHLIYTYRLQKRHVSKIRPMPYEVDVGEIMQSMRKIAVPLLIDMTGVVEMRTVISIWRAGAFGMPGQMTWIQAFLMVQSSILMVVGTIWLIHSISKPTLGNWPWMLATTMALIITAGYLF